MGYCVITCEDGWEAIRLVLVERPDLVIMDLEMPKMGGQDALEFLKLSHMTEQPPVLITSAHGDKDTILKTLQSGAADFLVKPYRFTELAERIAVHLVQYNYDDVKTLLENLNNPENLATASIWSGLDLQAYRNWNAFPLLWKNQELGVLIEKEFSLKQALTFNEKEMQERVLVLVKSRTRWRCAWPSKKSSIEEKAA
jgi:DNA-binding response OmpR family regulator